jgi:hypothetical protein
MGESKGAVEAFLPGGLVRLQTGEVTAMKAEQLVSGQVVTAVKASGRKKLHQRERPLEYKLGEEIHVLSAAGGKLRWYGVVQGQTGFFAMKDTDAAKKGFLGAKDTDAEEEEEEEGRQYQAERRRFLKEGAAAATYSPAAARRRIAALPAAERPPVTPVSPGAPLMGRPSGGDAAGLMSLVGRMTAETGGLPRTEKKKAKGKKLKKPVLQCWEAQEAVHWIWQYKLVTVPSWTREQAVLTMQQLLDERQIYNVADPWQTVFEDDGDLWRFWFDGPTPPLNVKVGLARNFQVRAPELVVKMLLESALILVRPFVKMTAAALPELDYYRLRELRRWIAFEVGACELQRVRLREFPDDYRRMAFWINVYNLLAVHSSICNKGLVSGGWRGGFFTDSCYLFDCSALSLFQIHSGILRNNSPLNPLSVTPLEPSDPMMQHVFGVPDPRVLFALSGCFRDSPPVRFAEPGDLNAFLTRATSEYLDE